MRLLIVLFLVAMTLGVTNLPAATYAILGFDPGTSVTHDVTWDLSSEIGERLSQETGSKVLSQEKTHSMLREKKLFSSDYESATDYARAVGKATGSDYVLFGAIRSADGGRRLNTYLLDVESGTVDKRGTTVIEGEPKTFAKQAAERCVESLGLASARSGQMASTVASAAALSGSVSNGGWVVPHQIDSFYSRFIKDHLSIGLRFSHFAFTEPSQRTYDAGGNLIGGYTAGISTYDLEERQKYLPYLYLLYKVNPYIALQIARERIEGRAWTLDFNDPHYNGNMILSGPSFTLLGRFANRTRFTPYGGIGIARLTARFQEGGSWSGGGRRIMRADDTTGIIYTLGSSVSAEGTPLSILDNVELDLSVTYMRAESDANYQLVPETRNRAEWTWPADSILYQIGVRYGF